MSSDLTVMLAARFLLGVGSEPLIVAITTALAKWFKGKELSFAFGINLTIARLGSVGADWSPTWAGFAYDGWQGPLVVAAVIGVLVLGAALAYGALEGVASRRYGLGQAGETDKLVLSDLFRFSRSFWFVVALCVTFYSAIFPFRSFAIKFFMESWEFTREVGRPVQQRAAPRRDGRHPALRSPGGQGGQAGPVHGVRVVPADAGLRDDGLPPDAAVGPDRP